MGILGYFFVPQVLWYSLIVDEEPAPSDVIIVLSGGADRVGHGVNLYQEGYADKMLFSGSVARNMSRQARLLGVNPDDILLETGSTTTNENAKFSYEIIKQQGFTSAIVVTSPYHTRRSSIMFRYYFQGIDLIVSSAPYDPSVSRNWWRERRLARLVLAEYPKLLVHYLFDR